MVAVATLRSGEHLRELRKEVTALLPVLRVTGPPTPSLPSEDIWQSVHLPLEGGITTVT